VSAVRLWVRQTRLIVWACCGRGYWPPGISASARQRSSTRFYSERPRSSLAIIRALALRFLSKNFWSRRGAPPPGGHGAGPLIFGGGREHPATGLAQRRARWVRASFVGPAHLMTGPAADPHLSTEDLAVSVVGRPSWQHRFMQFGTLLWTGVLIVGPSGSGNPASRCI